MVRRWAGGEISAELTRTARVPHGCDCRHGRNLRLKRQYQSQNKVCTNVIRDTASQRDMNIKFQHSSWSLLTLLCINLSLTMWCMVISCLFYPPIFASAGIACCVVLQSWRPNSRVPKQLNLLLWFTWLEVHQSLFHLTQHVKVTFLDVVLLQGYAGRHSWIRKL